MADPLALLREFTINKKEIAEMDDAVCFGDVAFLKTTKTNHAIYGTGREGQPKDYYTLEAILFMVKNADLSHATYVKAAHTKNMVVVKLPDRAGLLPYLKGESATCANIDKSVPLPSSYRRSELVARAAAHSQQQAQAAAAQQLQAAASGAQSGVASDQHSDGAAGVSGDALSSASVAKKPRLIEPMDDERAAQERQRLAAKLDSQNEPNEMHPEQLQEQLKNSSLSEAIPFEKIADIRAKRLAKKRQQIKEGIADVLAAGPGGDTATAQLGAAAAVEKPLGIAAHVHAQSALFAHDAAFTREILAHERRGRTRTSILQTSGSSGKSLFAQVEAILKLVRSKEDAKRNEALTANLPNPAAADAKKPSAPVTYNRYDQERFATSRETAGFKINVVETFHGAPLRSLAAQPSATDLKPALVAAASGQSQANVKPSLDSASRLVAASNPASASRGSTDAKADVKGRNGAPTQVQSPGGAKRQPKTPIIVIPATGSSLITMYNTEDILGKLQYVSTDDKRAAGVRRENDVLIHREPKQGPANAKVPIRVVDNPLKLSAEEWDRVVAVFVQGPLWQFKGWPYEGNPVELFTRMKAFHLKWAGHPLDANIKKWDVKVFELDRYKRHMDRAILQQFWEMLDVFVLKHKPHLRY